MNKPAKDPNLFDEYEQPPFPVQFAEPEPSQKKSKHIFIFVNQVLILALTICLALAFSNLAESIIK